MFTFVSNSSSQIDRYYIFWTACNQRLHNISIYFTTAISQGILLRKKHSSTFSQFTSLQMTKTCDQDGSPTWWCCTTVIFFIADYVSGRSRYNKHLNSLPNVVHIRMGVLLRIKLQIHILLFQWLCCLTTLSSL